MPLVPTKQWLMDMMFLQGSRWNTTEDIFLRLYKNKVEPTIFTTADQVHESTFLGYPGPVQLKKWLPKEVVWEDPRAVLKHEEVKYTLWQATEEGVYGHFVTDKAERLLWVEPWSLAPVLLFVEDTEIKVSPRYARTAEDP